MFFYKKIRKNLTSLLLTDSNRTRDDRRYLPRWQVNNKILYRRPDTPEEYECQSKDVNGTGACLRNPTSFIPNEKLDLTIYLVENIEPIRAQGHVVWQASQGGENLAGIHFDRISTKDQDCIFEYAFEFKKEELFKNWFKGW